MGYGELTLGDDRHLCSSPNQHFLHPPPTTKKYFRNTVAHSQTSNPAGCKTNMLVFVLEVRKRIEYQVVWGRWCVGMSRSFIPLISLLMRPVIAQPSEEQGRLKMCLIGLMRAHWHLSLGRVVCGFPRLPSGWVQSKSGDLYLALQMALWIISCGSPISSSVRFVAWRGLRVMKSRLFRWGSVTLHALSYLKNRSSRHFLSSSLSCINTL